MASYLRFALVGLVAVGMLGGAVCGATGEISAACPVETPE